MSTGGLAEYARSTRNHVALSLASIQPWDLILPLERPRHPSRPSRTGGERRFPPPLPLPFNGRATEFKSRSFTCLHLIRLEFNLAKCRRNLPARAEHAPRVVLPRKIRVNDDDREKERERSMGKGSRYRNPFRGLTYFARSTARVRRRARRVDLLRVGVSGNSI